MAKYDSKGCHTGDAEGRSRSEVHSPKNAGQAHTAETKWYVAQTPSRHGKHAHDRLRFREVTRSPKWSLVVTIMSLVFCSAAHGQSVFVDDRPRLLLDTEVGSETALGYKFPSISLGPSLEIPIANRFEFQASGEYSPDKKAITNDGELASVSGSVLGFATQRIGLIASVERGWLWTSQFDKAALFPSAGVVVRNDYFGHGRLYMTYTFPTGCVWATANNSCKIQSNRLQGITLHQDTRSTLHTRWGFETGLYHFCNEANPNEPQIGRTCHWGATARAIVRFEFHLGSRSRFTPADATESDNY